LSETDSTSSSRSSMTVPADTSSRMRSWHHSQTLPYIYRTNQNHSASIDQPARYDEDRSDRQDQFSASEDSWNTRHTLSAFRPRFHRSEPSRSRRERRIPTQPPSGADNRFCVNNPSASASHL